MNEYVDRYAMRKAAGRCTMCGSREPVPGRVRCKECAEIVSVGYRKIYNYRRAMGLCVRCGNDAAQDSCMCRACAYNDAGRMAKARQSRLAKGLCAKCGKVDHLPDISYCQQCKDKIKQSRDKTNAKKRSMGMSVHKTFREMRMEGK